MSGFRYLYSGVAQITLGAVVAQGIALLSLPLLTRTYGAEAFGIFGTILALAAVAAPAACLKFDRALLLPEATREVGLLAWLGLLSLLLTSVATLIVCATLSKFGAVPDWTYGLWAAGLVVANGLFALLTQLALRDGHYRRVATRHVVQGVATAAIQVGLGLARIGLGYGLLIGQLVGRWIGIVPLVKGASRYSVRPRAEPLREVAVTYWKFPVVFAPSALLNSFGSNIPILLTASLFGPVAAGALAVGQRLLQAPAALITQGVGQVVSAEIASRMRAGRSSLQLFRAATGMLFVLASAVATFVYSPVLLTVCQWVAPDWPDIPNYIRALAVSAIASLIVAPVSSVFTLYQAARASIAIDLSRPVLVLAFAYGFYAMERDPVSLVLGASIGQLANYVATWIVAYRLVRRN
ncbi:lipopolysaccharide biosynthesis protein [Ornithinimicrobium cryptoxanthini]|uniref:Oligosaccharide flippase family protein n=1 Tax=Ornithinimicrobium cryptoxanthini TaxID=2934161 RepID=A0ABY4YHU4_9MICO|nr:oligosaccharide flippase family protein [Ornithinimicrobium cryptoxanthini]USQ76101.1 oligosaccharide flippase family protein [Ornithinimicrobium cryptoxanthini]